MTYPRFALRRLFRVVNGGTPGPQLANWEGEVPWATPVDLGANGAFISSTSRSLTVLGAVTGSQVIAAGSLLLSTRAPIGYVAIAAVDMAFNQGCKALVPQQELDARYFYYQLVARSADLQAAGRGSTFMELPNEGLAALDVSAPGLEEQRRVADFLDGQVALLDRAIQLRQREIRLLEELQAEEIRVAVAGGVGSASIGSAPWVAEVHRAGRLQPLARTLTLQRGVDLTDAERRPGTCPVFTTAGANGFHDVAIVQGPGVVIGRYGSVGSVFWAEGRHWPHNTTLYVRDYKGNNPRRLPRLRQHYVRSSALSLSRSRGS